MYKPDLKVREKLYNEGQTFINTALHNLNEICLRKIMSRQYMKLYMI